MIESLCRGNVKVSAGGEDRKHRKALCRMGWDKPDGCSETDQTAFHVDVLQWNGTKTSSFAPEMVFCSGWSYSGHLDSLWGAWPK